MFEQLAKRGQMGLPNLMVTILVVMVLGTAIVLVMNKYDAQIDETEFSSEENETFQEFKESSLENLELVPIVVTLLIVAAIIGAVMVFTRR